MTTKEKLQNYFKTIRKLIVELNFYKDDMRSDEDEYPYRLATRIYIVSLIVFLLMTASIAAFIVRTIENVVNLPSASKFQYLAEKYPETIDCPCSQWAIDYEKFVAVDIHYHQVCSSEFVEQVWIDSIYIQKNVTTITSDDIRFFLSSFWQIIAALCRLIQQTITDALINFGRTNLVSPTAFTRQVIEAQAQATFDNSLEATKTQLTEMILVTESIMSANQLVSALGTNIYLQNLELPFWTMPYLVTRKFENCTCLDMNGCPRSAFIINPTNEQVDIPGLIIDCSITKGTLHSTLECYYNRECLMLLHDDLANHVEQLSADVNRRFSTTSTVEFLVDNLMIDTYSLNTSFDSYYAECDPDYCYYKYSRRFETLFIVTTVIGVFGFLSLVIRLIAPLIAKKIVSRRNPPQVVQEASVNTLSMCQQISM